LTQATSALEPVKEKRSFSGENRILRGGTYTAGKGGGCLVSHGNKNLGEGVSLAGVKSSPFKKTEPRKVKKKGA